VPVRRHPEHGPQGPTEEHLVEELAGILWRKRRLRLAEGAAHRRGLDRALESYRGTAKVAVVHLTDANKPEEAGYAVRASSEDTEAEIRDLGQVDAMAREALDLLDAKRNDAYEAAVAALPEDTREWWEEMVARDADELEHGEAPYTADIDGLRRFIETEVVPWFEDRRRDLANRPLVREQAFGEALDPDKLERLGRYEVHLDRKLERMLAMLIKLKELRAGEAES
jgi:hypothetical protein